MIWYDWFSLLCFYKKDFSWKFSLIFFHIIFRYENMKRKNSLKTGNERIPAHITSCNFVLYYIKSIKIFQLEEIFILLNSHIFDILLKMLFYVIMSVIFIFFISYFSLLIFLLKYRIDVKSWKVLQKFTRFTLHFIRKYRF